MKFVPWIISVACLGLLGWVWQDSQTKLEQKDAELAGLRQQYSELVTDANSKLEAAHGKVKQLTEEANEKLRLANNQLKELAGEADEKIQQANQREVPVTVGFRKAMLSSGHVAAFTNTSGQSIAVVAEVRRASSGQSRSFDITLDPGRKKELGEREGWAFVAGDTITVNQPGHKSLTFNF